MPPPRDEGTARRTSSSVKGLGVQTRCLDRRAMSVDGWGCPVALEASRRLRSVHVQILHTHFGRFKATRGIRRSPPVAVEETAFRDTSRRHVYVDRVDPEPIGSSPTM